MTVAFGCQSQNILIESFLRLRKHKLSIAFVMPDDMLFRNPPNRRILTAKISISCLTCRALYHIFVAQKPPCRLPDRCAP